MMVYIGDVNTARENKTQMPMLGGFLTVGHFNVELRGRTSDGSLIYRKIISKRRLTFEFQNMLPEHYEAWEAAQTLAKWREFEYEEKDGSFTKVIGNLEGNFGHVKLKTIGQWVYGQVAFILEEV